MHQQTGEPGGFRGDSGSRRRSASRGGSFSGDEGSMVDLREMRRGSSASAASPESGDVDSAGVEDSYAMTTFEKIKGRKLNLLFSRYAKKTSFFILEIVDKD